MPGTLRLWSEEAMSSAHQSLPENWRCSKSLFLHGRHMAIIACCYFWGNMHLICWKAIVPQIQARLGKKDLKKLFSWGFGLTGGWNGACSFCTAVGVWVHGPFYQQRCGTEHLSARGSGRPSWATAAGPASVPGCGWRWSWPFGVATAAREVKSRSSVPNISAKEICLQEIQTFEAFQIFLSEGVIYLF